MSRPIGTAEELERRRERAVQAVADGEPRKTVAKVLGVHVKTARRQVLAGRWNACRIGGRIRIPASTIRDLTTPRPLEPRPRAGARVPAPR